MCLTATVASAHVEIANAVAAGSSQIVRFTVGHGCSGADTVGVDVTIPKEITTVRALPSASFPTVEVKKDDTGAVTSVAFSKGDARPADDLFNEFAIRVAVPNTPFTTLLLPAIQHCKAADGTESTTEWVATPEEVAAAKEGEEPEPAPKLVILPARKPGWNKFTTTVAISSLSIFDDAQIVWVGDAAYSSNPTTKDQIKAESDVTELTQIDAGSDIWVRY
jgi:uncharacterized protein YcnI